MWSGVERDGWMGVMRSVTRSCGRGPAAEVHRSSVMATSEPPDAMVRDRWAGEQQEMRASE